MSELRPAQPVFFFASVLLQSLYFDEKHLLPFFNEKFGDSLLFIHDFFPMKSFYSNEMGNEDSLKRILFVFPVCLPREELVELKMWSHQLEQQFLLEKRRTVNLDVGYVSLENVVLATGKQFVHRIYLGRGVYADLNLVFENQTFKKLNWTYPDYGHEDFIKFFNWIRTLLLVKLKDDK